MMGAMYKFKTDKYKSARGGYSRLLDVSCAHCGGHVCFYQKDGPGMLKRMYFDRIVDAPEGRELFCPTCKRLLGVQMLYEKEKRYAYRLFAGAVVKKTVKATEIAT